MSSILAPTGLRPAGRGSYGVYNGGTTQFPLTTNNTINTAVGDIVSIVNGSVVIATAAAASGTLSANTPLGIVAGFEYNDPARGFIPSEILKANAVSSLGYTNIQVLVNDDAGLLMVVQANGPVPAAAVGASIGLTNFSAADMVVRTSRIEADYTTISHTTNTLPLKIVKILQDPLNAAGDAYTKILVRWNAGVHYWAIANAQ